MSVRKTITIPDDLIEDLELIARHQDRTISNLIIHATRAEIKKRMSKYRNQEKIKSHVGE